MQISSREDVFENLRSALVESMSEQGFQLPREAKTRGNICAALTAWVRLSERSVSAVSRQVISSTTLVRRKLSEELTSGLLTVQTEIEDGTELTQRLTRQYYRGGFNDFLYNAFQIQHLHLGGRNQSRDTTRRHPMAGGSDEILFVFFTPTHAFLIDIGTHDIFSCPASAKAIVRTALREWPTLFDHLVAMGVSEPDLTFEEAYLGKQAGFSVLFEVDGRVFPYSQLRDMKPQKNKDDERYWPTGTSFTVGLKVDVLMERIARLTNFAAQVAPEIAKKLKAFHGIAPENLALEVVQVGDATVLQNTEYGVRFFSKSGQFSFSVLRSGPA